MTDILSERYGARKIDEEYIKIKDIEIGLMPRDLKKDWVKHLVDIIDAGKKLPPVRVVRKRSEKYELLDGFHRLEAYRKSEVLMIPAEIWEVDEQYIYPLKVAFNLEHGLPFTKEEKISVFMKMYRDFPDWRIKDFAEALGVSERTISEWKKKLGLTQNNRKLTEEDKTKITEMAREGYSTRKIAQELGISQPRVVQILNELSHENKKEEGTGDKERSSSALITNDEEVIFDFEEDDVDLEEDIPDEPVYDYQKQNIIRKAEYGWRRLEEFLKAFSKLHPELYEPMKQFHSEVLDTTRRTKIKLDWQFFENWHKGRISKLREVVLSLDKSYEENDITAESQQVMELSEYGSQIFKLIEDTATTLIWKTEYKKLKEYAKYYMSLTERWALSRHMERLALRLQDLADFLMSFRKPGEEEEEKLIKNWEQLLDNSSSREEEEQ